MVRCIQASGRREARIPIRYYARIGLLTTLIAAVLLAPAAAESPPRPPCDGAGPLPPYAKPGAAPAIQIWAPSEAGSAWTPPPCTGWSAKSAGLLVALAAQFSHGGQADALLLRFGAISSLKGLRYWSVTESAWRTLITDAVALNGPDLGAKRGDFTLAELRSGKALYFAQSDNRASGAVVYRMDVKDIGPTRLVVAVENVSPVRKLMLTLFEPGDLQSLHFLERAGPKGWSYYGLAWASETRASRLAVPEASYVNRAKALYGHLAGLPAPQP
jgi:hypothetical protein